MATRTSASRRLFHVTLRCPAPPTDADFDAYKRLVKRLGRQYGLEVVDHRTDPPIGFQTVADGASLTSSNDSQPK